jgi:hypothetical protein
MLTFATKDWTTPTNLYNLPSRIALAITLVELEDFNQYLMILNSILKPYFVN